MRYHFEYLGKTGQTTIFKKKQNLKKYLNCFKIVFVCEKNY